MTARNEVRAKVVQAVNVGRMAGSIPGDLLRQLDSVIHPDVPWHELVRPTVHSLARFDETWAKRNRRFSSVYLPSVQRPQVGPVVLIGDTSGSITDEDLRKIGGTAISIMEEVQPVRIHVLWADAAIAGEQEFDAGDHVDLQPRGGGGTDMRVPLARAADFDPVLVVLVTDGLTPWPTEPPDYNLVVLTTNKPAPFGEVIKI